MARAASFLLGGEPARHEPAGTADPPPFFQKRPFAKQRRLHAHRVEAGHVAGGIGAGEMDHLNSPTNFRRCAYSARCASGSCGPCSSRKPCWKIMVRSSELDLDRALLVETLTGLGASFFRLSE